MTAHHDEVVGFRRAVDLDFAHGDLDGAPAVLDMGTQPHPHRPFLRHLLEFQAGLPRYADTRDRRHLVLDVFRRGISPDGFHRTEGNRLVGRVPPVHHYGADRALHAGNPLLLVARRRIGELRQDDLAANVEPFIVLERAGADIDQLAGDSLVQGQHAVAERIGLDDKLDGRLHGEFGVLGKADQRRQFVDDGVLDACCLHRIPAVRSHPAPIFRACGPVRNVEDDLLDVVSHIVGGDSFNNGGYGHECCLLVRQTDKNTVESKGTSQRLPAAKIDGGSKWRTWTRSSGSAVRRHR